MKQLKNFFAVKSNQNLAIAGGLILIYLCLFFVPKIKQIFGLTQQSSKLNKGITSVQKDWTNINQLNNQLTVLKEKKDQYERRLPNEKEVPAILEYLSNAAKKLNVRISEIKPVEQALVPGQIYYSVPVLVKAECRYHQLGRFLSELEKADRFMKITDLKIVANPSQNETLFVQLIIVTYVMA